MSDNSNDQPQRDLEAEIDVLRTAVVSLLSLIPEADRMQIWARIAYANGKGNEAADRYGQALAQAVDAITSRAPATQQNS
jgi:hypothetical protein